ncbi:hypothetical protein CYLTODRAFT_3141 [Cylindrobasidium torrendii FP15055 ss-10]|uniref:Phosphatidylinositol N-acetylglucosaminyltransferase subunit H conserved domain-containing protein n=1 Tax=Cylindrobasidium torrendii FP15055 ss-10 TaxID=1314674 RepID=A0A0D7BXI9_9AGAR|nr:hypothetical protein CYLTODRAFT_3141 [Cylindrobasidium torrendii FP15055 ss-10]
MPEQFVAVHTATFHEFRIECIENGTNAFVTILVLGTLSSVLYLYSAYLPLVLAIALLWRQQNSLISESLFIVPGHGIQLEQQRGPRTFRRTTRRFVPLSRLRDVVINEGLSGWNVRYYLAVVTEDQTGATRLEVVFEVRVGQLWCALGSHSRKSFLPRFPILHKVYNEVHDILEDDWRGDIAACSHRSAGGKY